jgi:hypothetical protein
MSADEQLPAPESDKTDAAPHAVALIALGLVLIIAFCLSVAAWFYHHRDRGADLASTLAPDGRFQHGPDERTGIEQAWREQDRLVHEHLDTYGWTDHAAGIVHIPITRAMDLMLAEQKPAVSQPAQSKAAP